MEFIISYKSVMFFIIGITAILSSRSESQKNRPSFYEIDDPYSKDYDTFTPYYDRPIQPATKSGTKSMLAILFPSESLRNIPQESSYYASRSTAFKSPKSNKSQPDSAECPPLRRHSVTRDLLYILSSEIVSKSDPFRDLIDKMMKIRIDNIPDMNKEVNRLLKFERLPQCYIPLAETLSSLLPSWHKLKSAAHHIKSVQQLLSPKYTDYSFLPVEISSSTCPELLDLFSGDIFDDPKPPMRLLYKLLDMPKNNILNLKAQLKKLVEWSKKTLMYSFSDHRPYYHFADTVWDFLQDQYAFEKLKQNVAAIRIATTSDKILLPATPINSSETHLQDEFMVNQ